MKKIFIIDDDPSTLRLLEYYFKQIGTFKIITETNGLNGFELIKNDNPDLIILDIQIPGISGIDICKKLREIEKFKKVPIIAHTSLDKNIYEQEILNAGFNHFLPKLIEYNDFINNIKLFMKIL